MFLKLNNTLKSIMHGKNYYASHGANTVMWKSSSYYFAEIEGIDRFEYQTTNLDNLFYSEMDKMIYDLLNCYNSNSSDRFNTNYQLIKIPHEIEFAISMIHNIQDGDYLIYDNSHNRLENVIAITNKSWRSSAPEIKIECYNDFVMVDDPDDPTVGEESEFNMQKFSYTSSNSEKKRQPQYIMHLPDDISTELLKDIVLILKHKELNSYYWLYDLFFSKFDSVDYYNLMNLTDKELLSMNLKKTLSPLLNKVSISVPENVILEAINAFSLYKDDLGHTTVPFEHMVQFLYRWQSLYSLRNEKNMKIF